MNFFLFLIAITSFLYVNSEGVGPKSQVLNETVQLETPEVKFSQRSLASLTRRRRLRQRQCSCGIRNYSGAREFLTSTRIVGGILTKAGELPWRAAVFVQNKMTGRGGICGGTIISQRWVMTAAHCTMDFQPGRDVITVYVGAQANPVTAGSGTEILADRFIQHPYFNRRNLNNDITLIQLSTPIQFKANVAPVCLPFGELARSEFSGAKVIASGWGTTNPVGVNQENSDTVANSLRIVELPVLTTAQCSKYERVTRNQICTYEPSKDTCQGDSGGSIDFKYSNGFYYAIGVVSYGYGCAQRGYPGVYTKVNNYLDWIETVTKDTFCKK